MFSPLRRPSSSHFAAVGVAAVLLFGLQSVPAQHSTEGYLRDDGWRAEDQEAWQLAAWSALKKSALQKSLREAIVVTSEGPPETTPGGPLMIGAYEPVGEPVSLPEVWRAAQKGGGALGRGTVGGKPGSGAVTWSARIVGQGAGAVSLHLEEMALPPGVELWVYDATGGVDGPFTGGGNVWTNPVAGEDLYVELRIPGDIDPGALEGGGVLLGEVGWFDPAFTGPGPLGKGPCPGNEECVVSGECIDESDFAHIEDLRRAVGLVMINNPDGLSACTGTLIASADASDPNAYLITASHCFESDLAVRSLRVFWDFRKESCEGEDDCPPRRSPFPDQTGAERLYSGDSEESDATLVKLDDTPPGERYHVGWTLDVVTYDESATLHRIHHANAEAQSYTRHQPVADPTIICSNSPHGQTIYSESIHGQTDNGSSGSAVVTGDNLFVGQNQGRCGIPFSSPKTTCNTAILRTDGAFAEYFEHVKEFLDPDGTIGTPTPTPPPTDTPTPTPSPTATPTPSPTVTPTPTPVPTDPGATPTPTPTPHGLHPAQVLSLISLRLQGRGTTDALTDHDYDANDDGIVDAADLVRMTFELGKDSVEGE